MRVLLSGCGVVGTRAARFLATLPGVSSLVLDDPRFDHLERVVTAIGSPCETLGSRDWAAVRPDVVVLAGPARHFDDARRAIRLGAHVVSVGDDLGDVVAMLRLDEEARRTERCVLVGAGFAPGLTCLLAVHGAEEFDEIEELHVAKTGTAGPACARQHHEALRSNARDWRDGAWIERPGGSGRELCWFPEPIGGADCYRAALPDPLLLHPAFPQATRITARMSATRRDRLTSRLPMMRKPHPEAGPGAVRVEIRGRRNGVADTLVLGSMDRPSIGSAAVLAVATGAVLTGKALRNGAGGLAEMLEPLPALAHLLELGVRCAKFEGSTGTAR